MAGQNNVRGGTSGKEHKQEICLRECPGQYTPVGLIVKTCAAQATIWWKRARAYAVFLCARNLGVRFERDLEHAICGLLIDIKAVAIPRGIESAASSPVLPNGGDADHHWLFREVFNG
jgi:hypothetical protein